MPLDRAYKRLGSTMQAFQQVVSWRQGHHTALPSGYSAIFHFTHMAEPAQAPPSEKCKHAWDARLCQGNLVWNTVLTCDAQESSEAVQIAWNTCLQILHTFFKNSRLYEPCVMVVQNYHDTSSYHTTAPHAKNTPFISVPTAYNSKASSGSQLLSWNYYWYVKTKRVDSIQKFSVRVTCTTWFFPNKGLQSVVHFLILTLPCCSGVWHFPI